VVSLAAAGQFVFFVGDARADTAAGRAVGWFAAREDLEPNLRAATALAHGQSSYPWYGDSVILGYAPQYTVMLAPLAVLPLGIAEVVTRLLALVLIAAIVAAWARGPDGEVPTWALVFLVSLPVVSLLRLDQMMSVVGLAALTVAIWAQRRDRWLVVGLALAVGLSRTTNALPVLVMVVISAWGRPAQLLRAVAGIAVVIAPLTVMAYVWDPNWVADYLHNLSVYNLVGPVKLARALMGFSGPFLLEAVVCALAGLLAWRDRGRALDLDRAALALSLGVLSTIISTYYVAIYAMPALIRLAWRRGFRGLPWVVTAAPWVVILISAPVVLSSAPIFPPGLLTGMVLVMVAAAYPLFRSARPVAATLTG
jgi:Glycosyltransferase family 87